MRSIKFTTDLIMIADKSAFGMYCSAGVTTYNASSTNSAANRLDTEERAPQSAFTAVRENDPADNTVIAMMQPDRYVSLMTSP